MLDGIRVALVTSAMRCGGVETFMVRLAKLLTQAGSDVEIVTTDEPGEWFDTIARNGLKGANIRHRSRTRLGRGLEVGRWLAQRRYNVIFLNHARYAQASINLIGNDVIVVPIVHNDYDDVYRVACANHRAWNVAAAVSPRVHEIAQARVPGRPILNICSGVELPSEDAWSHRSTLQSTVRLVFVGRVAHFQKGADMLPDILKACLNQGVDAVLTVVGTGPDLPFVQRKVEDLGVTSRVVFRGVIEPQEVYATLLSSHILLMPSSFEGLPLTLLEAMACGCVPVASLLPGVTDAAIEDGQCGVLVEFASVSGFAKAVGGIAKIPDRWAQMSLNAHRRACDLFSLQTMGQRYSHLILDALSGRYPLPRARTYQLPLDLSLFPPREGIPPSLRAAVRKLRTLIAPVFSTLGSMRP